MDTSHPNKMQNLQPKGSSSPHWDAALYKKYSNKLQKSSAEALLAKFSFKGNERILDIGCGDGKISAAIASVVPQGSVHGIDLSEGMINLAQQDFSMIKNITFSLMDAEELPLSERYDFIVSFFCLQWVKNKGAVFNKISTLMNPSAKLAVIMTDRNPYLLKVRLKLFQQDFWAQWFKDYQDPTLFIDDDNYVTYAKQANLKNITYTESLKSVFFDHYEEMWSFIKMVTPAIEKIPTESLKKKFIDELVEGYLALLPKSPQGEYYISYTIKTLVAENGEA